MQAVCVGGSSASYLRGRGPRPAATGSGATSKVTSTFSALPAGLQARHRGKPHSQLVVTAALSTIDQARHGMKISLVNPPSLSCVKSGSSGLQRSKQQRRGLVSSTASSSSRRTAVRVQASLVARVLRIVRAYLGNAVSSIEQPEVLLRQAVEDMQADLAAARRAQVRVAADQRLAAKRAAAAAANADTWQRRAEQVGTFVSILYEISSFLCTVRLACLISRMHLNSGLLPLILARWLSSTACMQHATRHSCCFVTCQSLIDDHLPTHVPDRLPDRPCCVVMRSLLRRHSGASERRCRSKVRPRP